MRKIIKKYLCIVAILSTMMGYAQTMDEVTLNEVVVRANAADQAYKAWLQQIADGQAQMAMAEALAKLKAEALARAEAIAIADAQAQGPASSTKKYGEKPMTKNQFDAYIKALKELGYGFKYKTNYVVTTSDGKTHTGTITVLTNKMGHDMHYFTPNGSDGRYTVGMYYRITNYESSSATTTGGSGSTGSTGTTTTPFTYDSSGFPIGKAYYTNESGVSAGITISSNNSPVTVISIAQLTWYMDYDGDGWHSITQEKSTPPGAFGWRSTTKGLDCDDKDDTKTSDCSGNLPIKGWFLDNDFDGYFAEVQQSTTKPTAPGNWTDVMTKGPDCNDKVASADNSVCVATPTPCTNKTVCSAGYSLVNCECVPDVPLPDPCETLKKLNEDIKYKEKLAEVIAKAKTDSTKEYGYSISKGSSDYVAGTNNALGNLLFSNRDQNYGIIHDHTLPRATIGPDGLPGTTVFVQMFSPVDIESFVTMLNNTAANGAAIGDVFSTLVTSTGEVYTLKYEGTYNDIQGKSIDVHSETLNSAYDTNFGDAGISRYGGIENAFAAFLELDVKIPGIVVYKTTPGETPTKLGITSDGTKISASNMPCK